MSDSNDFGTARILALNSSLLPVRNCLIFYLWCAWWQNRQRRSNAKRRPVTTRTWERLDRHGIGRCYMLPTTVFPHRTPLLIVEIRVWDDSLQHAPCARRPWFSWSWMLDVYSSRVAWQERSERWIPVTTRVLHCFDQCFDSTSSLIFREWVLVKI